MKIGYITSDIYHLFICSRTQWVNSEQSRCLESARIRKVKIDPYLTFLFSDSGPVSKSDFSKSHSLGFSQV